jgi:hypothetical protein
VAIRPDQIEHIAEDRCDSSANATERRAAPISVDGRRNRSATRMADAERQEPIDLPDIARIHSITLFTSARCVENQRAPRNAVNWFGLALL